MTQGEYEIISDEDMENLYNDLEAMCEAGSDNWEVDYSVNLLSRCVTRSL